MTVVTQLKPPSHHKPDHADDPAAGCERRRRLAGLLEACAEGDRQAFRALYDLSARFVFGVVRAVVSDYRMAEEVAQEVYVSIWKRAGSFDPQKGNPMAWMAAIARNRAIDRLRAERARGFIVACEEIPDIPGDDTPADLTVDALAVRRALVDLRPEWRDALLLFYFRGYTHSELAGIMDIPVGTAKSWLRRGLSALKEALE